MTASLNIFDCTSAQFIQRAPQLGFSQHQALQHYRNFYRHGIIESAPPAQPALRDVAHIETEGDTTKFTLAHGENGESLFSESVIIPYSRPAGRSRTTLCVSSQIGCAMGCTFCQTAQLGLLKNLEASDIVEQWFIARHQLNSPIDNIVFMGMGEPMDNLQAVLRSIEILTDHNGASIAPARITVSTVGRCAGIRQLVDFTNRPGFHSIKLAVSVNAPNDSIRQQIMPINRAEPMADLLDAMQQYRGRVFIEYVLIPTVNMELEHADELAAYLQPLRCKVNVIPYNPRQDSPWPAPENEHIEAFTNRLIDHGLFVTCRRTTGRDVAAACGQLGITTPTAAHRSPASRKAQLTVTT